MEINATEKRKKKVGRQGVVMLLFAEDGQKKKEIFESKHGGSEGVCHKNSGGFIQRQSFKKHVQKSIFWCV